MLQAFRRDGYLELPLLLLQQGGPVHGPESCWVLAELV
jgi:hypothetical protein